MPARPPHRGETSATLRCVGPRRRQPITPRTPRKADGCGPHTAVSPVPYDHKTEDTIPAQRKKHSERRRAGAAAHTHQIKWVGISLLASVTYTVSHNINTVLLQYAPNLFNLLLIHASNTNATVDIAVTVLHDFELKRDTIQTENYLPAQ